MNFNVSLKNLLADIQRAVIAKEKGKKFTKAQTSNTQANTNYRLSNELDPNDDWGGLISFSTKNQNI